MSALFNVIVGASLLLMQLLGVVHALGTNYVHDGKTTYCWHIPQKPANTKLNESDRVDGYSGINGCPMQMTVTLSTNKAQVLEDINVTWTVIADFSGTNEVNMTKLAYGPDSNGNPAQIVHSNVHSCVYGTGCDPFNDGTQLVDKTVNQIANLTDNEADFKDVIRFPNAGDYSLLAHIIMPDTNSSERFDYAVYIELVVVEEETEAPAVTTPTPTSTTVAPVTVDSDDGGLSSKATIAIIVGSVAVVVGIVLIAVIMWRRRRESDHAGYMAPPTYEAAVEMFNAPKGNERAGSEAATTRTTEGFSKSAYRPSSPRSSQNLDGTGGSNTSGAPSFTSYDNHGLQQTRPLDGSGYRPGSVASGENTGRPRPRRIDSDVEL